MCRDSVWNFYVERISNNLEDYNYAIALHFVYYNFAKIHKSLRVTSAMQARLIKRITSIEDMFNLVPESQIKKRGFSKKEKFKILSINAFV